MILRFLLNFVFYSIIKLYLFTIQIYVTISGIQFPSLQIWIRTNWGPREFPDCDRGCGSRSGCYTTIMIFVLQQLILGPKSWHSLSSRDTVSSLLPARMIVLSMYCRFVIFLLMIVIATCRFSVTGYLVQNYNKVIFSVVSWTIFFFNSGSKRPTT